MCHLCAIRSYFGDQPLDTCKVKSVPIKSAAIKNEEPYFITLQKHFGGIN